MILHIYERTNNLNINRQVVRVLRVYNRNIPNGITQDAFTQKGGLLVGSEAGEYSELSPGTTGQYLTPDTAEPLGLKWITPTISIEDTTNHLINGGLDLAKRQTPNALTTISDGTYGPDRFKIYRENADIQYIRQDAAGETGLTSTYYGQFKKITNAGKFLICQPLEYFNTLKFRGKAVNFQLQMKASGSKTIKIAIVQLQSTGTADTLPSLVSAWGADSTDPTLGANLATIGTPVSCSVTTSWAVSKFTGTFPSTAKNLLVMIWTDADFSVNDTLSIAEAGLYFGEAQRSWTPPGIEDTIQKCNRYCWKTFLLDTAPAQNAGGTGAIRFIAGKAGAGAEMGYVRLPVTMRTTPSVTTYNTDATNAQVRDATAGADCSAIAATPTADDIIISATGNASTAVGNILRVHILATAEL